MDAINFRFLISLAVFKGLDMHLTNVITTYLYGSIDNAIYMKIRKGFKLRKGFAIIVVYVDDLILVGTLE